MVGAAIGMAGAALGALSATGSIFLLLCPANMGIGRDCAASDADHGGDLMADAPNG